MTSDRTHLGAGARAGAGWASAHRGQAEAALESLPDDELVELDELVDEDDEPESELPPAFTVLLVEVLRESVR